MSNSYRPSAGHQQRPFTVFKQALALTVGLGVSLVASAVSNTWTTEADFNQGTRVGVTSTADGRLVLSITGSTFPVLWVANAGDDTLSKIATRAEAGFPVGRELARYRTWFGPSGQAGFFSHVGNAYAGAAPSRTSVDVDGNAYILNRHFDGSSASLLKILSNSFVDRNGNGVADTSADLNNDGIISTNIADGEMKPMADTNGNGIIDPSEIQDERIAWAVRVPDGVAAPLRSGRLGRSMCIATDGNLWIGLYNDNAYYKISSVDGRTLAGPVNVGATPYGCLVDSAGKMFGATLGSQMTRLDTVTGASLGPINTGQSNYGIGLGQDYVFLGNYSGSTFTRVNKSTMAVDFPAASKFTVYGLSVDGTGAVVTGGVSLADGVHRFNPNTGAIICSNTGNTSGEARGVIADADDNVWVILRTANRVSKYDKNCNKLGFLPVGSEPYTYSDAAGLAARSITTRTGDWNIVFDGAAPNTPWGRVDWSAIVPAGGSLVTSVRASDTLAALGGQSFIDVPNGAPIVPAINGRFIETRVRMAASTGGDSPVLSSISITSAGGVACDVNNDGKINSLDINAIIAARNSVAAPGDVRDSDGDGKVTVLDARKCALVCTKPGCAL